MSLRPPLLFFGWENRSEKGTTVLRSQVNYSRVPNRRPVPNKRPGHLIQEGHAVTSQKCRKIGIFHLI